MLTKKTIILKLIKIFLLKNNIYSKFLKNYNINKRSLGLTDLLKRDPYNLINTSFEWCKAEEGIQFWCNMHTSWCNFLNHIDVNLIDVMLIANYIYNKPNLLDEFKKIYSIHPNQKINLNTIILYLKRENRLFSIIYKFKLFNEYEQITRF